MEWDAIGAIGEIVGAIAVVLTLGYLAVQMKQNAAATRAQTAQNLADSINGINLILAGNLEQSRISRKGFDDWESLNEDEKFCWHWMAVAACRSLEAALTNARLKQADQQSIDLAKESVRGLFATSAYQRWWREERSMVVFTEDFVRFVEDECL